MGEENQTSPFVALLCCVSREESWLTETAMSALHWLWSPQTPVCVAGALAGKRETVTRREDCDVVRALVTTLDLDSEVGEKPTSVRILEGQA